MKRAILVGAAALAALTLAACDEAVDYIPESNPPQFIVEDRDGKLDDRIINKPCKDFGSKVERVVPMGGAEDDGERAIVTCKARVRP